MVVAGFRWMLFINLRKFSSIFILQRFFLFIVNVCWILSHAFYVLFDIIVLILFFSILIEWIPDFQILDDHFILGIHSPLIMVYNSFVYCRILFDNSLRNFACVFIIGICMWWAFCFLFCFLFFLPRFGNRDIITS